MRRLYILTCTEYQWGELNILFQDMVDKIFNLLPEFCGSEIPKGHKALGHSRTMNNILNLQYEPFKNIYLQWIRLDFKKY
jgi:hypothetical protein